MKDDGPEFPRPVEGAHRPEPLPRKPSLASRARSVVRGRLDQVLGADVAWSVLFVAVMLLLLESRHWGSGYGTFAPGQGVASDVVATHDFEIHDDDLTAKRREAASEAIPDVYVLDTQSGPRLASELSRVFEDGRKALVAASALDTGADPWSELRKRIGEAPLEVLRQRGFAAEIERALVAALARGQHGPIVVSKPLLERKPVILVTRVPGGGEERMSSFASVVDLDEARREVREAVLEHELLTPPEREILAGLVASFVDASLAYDTQGTIARRESAAAAVPPVRILVPEGTVLLRSGEKVTPESLALIEAARKAVERRFGTSELLGTFTVLAMLAFFLYRYSIYHQRHFKKIRNLNALLVLVLVLMMLVAEGMLWVVRGLADDLSPPFDHVSSYTYLIPLGGGAILVALLANGRIAIVYSAFASVLFGALVGWDAPPMVWALLVQLAGVYAISTYRERAALLWAGLVVGGAGSAAALAVEVLRGAVDPPARMLFSAACAFAGGALGVGLLVSFALPLLEGLFHALTDIRLLELSNVNHPLLSQLAIKAPGSYNHSLVVGTLAQEAAKAIGANSLFCRVAAFYRDIGKIQKPEYYVENQHGDNPHDRLSPSMSALIIAAHVKDGIRIAREAHLPEQIVDIIPQHHGTRLMTYFYDKARKGADPALGPVSEDDFRYPGPKPRTAEAAIFMLADAVEAAARTVDEPTPGRLREVIRKVTNAVVLDRQLDECDLTFADLERIQEAFLRTLVGMHHHRPDYPGFVFGRPKGERPGGDLDDRRMARGN